MSASTTSNFVSEWYGHRVYPTVLGDDATLRQQQQGLCPFLSAVARTPRLCVKSQASHGVCTISSESNGQRQDWLVCPNRVLGTPLVEDAAKELFGMRPEQRVDILPASSLESDRIRMQAVRTMAAGGRILVLLHEKMGGEISIPSSERSPEIAFDMTLAEIVHRKDRYCVGSFGILEVQTMDFHGTYRNAVKNLKDALRLHGKRFYGTVRQNPHWLADKIEGPNKANVFKRTFYQLAFKFQLGAAPQCVGCTLAIPTAVWDSWQPHLGKPELAPLGRQRFALLPPRRTLDRGRGTHARICVFEPDAADRASPNSLKVQKVILTNADALAHFALRVAPEAAVGSGGLIDLVPRKIAQRLSQWWPGLTC